jgi:hypothetical protein
MRISIEAESQEEFDSKRSDLIKALAGSKFEVKRVERPGTRYDLEKSPGSPRGTVFEAQRQILEHWDAKFHAMISDLKKEVGEILE